MILSIRLLNTNLNVYFKTPKQKAILLKHLRDITKIQYINFDTVKSAYVTYCYKHYKTYDTRETLFKLMRDSVHKSSKEIYQFIKMTQ